MSRIGRLPIAVPSTVDVTIDGRQVTVKGPKGTLSRALHPDMSVSQEDGTIVVTRPTEQKTHKQLHGLTRTLVNNMVVGVTDGYRKGLEITGVGYRAALNGSKLTLNLGYSHPIEIDPPEGISFELENPTRLAVVGIDKELVGQIAAKVRSTRKPEPYKGKGVSYAGEADPPQGRQGRQDRRQEVTRTRRTDTMTQVASRGAARRKRHDRIRLTMAGTDGRPRLAVFRSLNHIYAQVIDDASGKTLAAASTAEKELKGSKSTKTEEAAVVGRLVAERAKAAGIERVVFDRAGFRYHGRIKSLADAAREAGLDF